MKHTVFKRCRSDKIREMSINGMESNEKLGPVRELTASVFETNFVIRVSGGAAVSRGSLVYSECCFIYHGGPYHHREDFLRSTGDLPLDGISAGLEVIGT